MAKEISGIPDFETGSRYAQDIQASEEFWNNFGIRPAEKSSITTYIPHAVSTIELEPQPSQIDALFGISQIEYLKTDKPAGDQMIITPSMNIPFSQIESGLKNIEGLSQKEITACQNLPSLALSPEIAARGNRVATMSLNRIESLGDKASQKTGSTLWKQLHPVPTKSHVKSIIDQAQIGFESFNPALYEGDFTDRNVTTSTPLDAPTLSHYRERLVQKVKDATDTISQLLQQGVENVLQEQSFARKMMAKFVKE